MDLGLRTVAVPCQFVWDVLLSSSVPVVHEDNNVAITIVRTGKNQTMRHLTRTHGLCVGWLNERLVAGGFELVYEPSASMRADIFTKSITNPQKWTNACNLIGLSWVDDVVDVIRRDGRPTPPPEGGGKLGSWSFNEDGSGTWTRLDPRAFRYASLYSAGPDLHEVSIRTTYDAKTGEMIGVPLREYSTAKFRNEPLPPPVPRSIRSVFAFDHTAKFVPPECRDRVPPAPMET